MPIGSFQAIQHTLADVSVALDGAQLLVRKAAWALDTGNADAATLAAYAFLFAAEHAQRATERVLHFHGGYGFMQEYDIQLFYRRAKGWPLVLGAAVERVRPARRSALRAASRIGGGLTWTSLRPTQSSASAPRCARSSPSTSPSAFATR